jgi:HD-like signal output (HDOD) protein
VTTVEQAPAPGLAPPPEISGDAELLDRHLQKVFQGQVDRLAAEYGGAGDHGAVLDALRAPGAHEIKQPPLAAQAVLNVCRRRNYSVAELNKLISRDPALSQALLRHANSAWYTSRLAGKVISINAAVQRVGTKGVHATVMAHVMEGELSRPGPGLDKMVQQVWKHMVRTAPISRALSRAFRQDPDAAYTLGLLHDAGKLVILDRVAGARKKVRRDLKLSDEFVSQLLRTLHEPLGALAALQWGIDADHAASVASHHRASTEEGQTMAELLFLAEKIDLANTNGAELDLDALWAEGKLSGDRALVEGVLEAGVPQG